jgi:quercetin dioxygenase-like cupin family protein
LRGWISFVPIVLLLGLSASACGDDDQPQSAAAGITATTRQVLNAATSDRAPGQEIGLSRVIVPAGAEIAPHTHPGTQLAFIAEGTLTYTVYSGEVAVTRSAGLSAAANEVVAAGSTTKLNAGDSLVERPGMQHSAKNEGKTPVVIYLSSLFESGVPASSPADVKR